MNMIVFEGESIPKKYRQILRNIIENGGVKLELSPVALVSHDPRKRLFGHPTRGEESIYTYIKGLWILLGEEKVNRLTHYIASQEQEQPISPPGPRLRRMRPLIDQDWKLSPGPMGDYSTSGNVDQLQLCYDRLMLIGSAVATIYNPIIDWQQGKDIPLTISLQFLIRDRKLDMIVHSCHLDAWHELIYDTGVYQWFQEIMAGWVQKEVGIYTHIAGRLYLNESNLEKAKELIKMDEKWDLYDEVEILDARVPIDLYQLIETGLGQFEESCRLGYELQSNRPLPSYPSLFYDSLAQVIYAYNCYQKGYTQAALTLLEKNRSDLATIYKKRWSK